MEIIDFYLRLTRFERATCRSAICCSIQLSYNLVVFGAGPSSFLTDVTSLGPRPYNTTATTPSPVRAQLLGRPFIISDKCYVTWA